MHCGTKLVAPAQVPMQPQAQVPIQQPYQAASPPVYVPKKRNWALIFAAFAVIAVLAGIGTGTLLMARKSDPSNVLGANASRSDDVLAAHGTSAPDMLKVEQEIPTITEVKPQPGEQMPDDVRAWLRHLERTEAERARLTTSQLGELTAMAFQMKGAGAMEALQSVMNDPEGEQKLELPASKMHEDTERLREKWGNLSAFFNSVTPPAECVPIKNSYEVALRETRTMVLDVMDVLEQASEPGADPQALVSKLMGMKGASGTIDQAGKSTDTQVQEICDKYSTRKWFFVSGDIGDSGMLKVLGSGL